MNTENTTEKSTKPPWKIRRRIINITLFFCAFCILYILFKGDDNKVNETIVTMSFFTGSAVIGSYVFGAVWEDKK